MIHRLRRLELRSCFALSLFVLGLCVQALGVNPIVGTCADDLGDLAPMAEESRGFFDRTQESLTDKDWETIEVHLRQVYGRDQLRKMGPIAEDVIQGALMELIADWSFYRGEVASGRSELEVLRHVLTISTRKNRQEVGDLMPGWAIEEGKTNEGSFVEDYRRPERESLESQEWFENLSSSHQDFVTAFKEGHQTPSEVARVLGLSDWKEAVRLGQEVRGQFLYEGRPEAQTVPITETEAKQLATYVQGDKGSGLGTWFYDRIRLSFGLPHLGVNDVQMSVGKNGTILVRLEQGPENFIAQDLKLVPTRRTVSSVGLTDFINKVESSQLTEEQKVLVKYRFWRGQSVKEIARRVDQPWRRVAATLERAKKELKKTFGNPMRVDSFRVELDGAGKLHDHLEALERGADRVANQPGPLAAVRNAEDARAVWLSRYQLQVIWDWKVQQGSLPHIAHQMDKKSEALRSAVFSGFLPKLSKRFGVDRLAFDSIAFIRDPSSPSNPMAMVRHGGQWVAVPLRSHSGEPHQSTRADYVISREDFYRMVHSMPRPYRAAALLLFEDRLSDQQVMHRLGIAPSVVQLVKGQVTSRLRHHTGEGKIDASNLEVSENTEAGQMRLAWSSGGGSVLRVSPKDLAHALEMLTPATAEYARTRLEGWTAAEVAASRGVTENSARNLSSAAMRELGARLGWNEKVGVLYPRDIIVLESPSGTGRKRKGDIRPSESPVGNSLPQQIRYYLSQRKSGGDARVSMTGLAKMAQDLGVSDMRTMYHAAVIAVGRKTAEERRWAPFPGTPELALRVRGALQSKANAARFTGLDGFQRFADRYFKGDLPSAWDGARGLMGKERFIAELDWGDRPTPKAERSIRLVEVEQREPNALGARLGQLRGAFEMGEPELARVYRAGLREKLEPALKSWVSFSGTPGEMLHVLNGLLENQKPVQDFVGSEGLRRFADQFFDGQVNRAFQLAREGLSEQQFDALKWTEKVSPPKSGPERFYGTRIPASRPGPVVEVELSPAQRAAAAAYLHGFVQHGRVPSRNEIGATAMGRLSELFGSLPEAQLRIKEYGREFGLSVRLVEGVIETPPNEALRKEWQRESVDLYLEWMLRNGGKLPTQPDWGRKTEKEKRVGVDQARMFGADVYAPGKPQADYRIFESQQDALLAVAARAEQLGIPFSLLRQKFQSNETTPELRSAWQKEARGLLEAWRDANPGKVPKALDWGNAEGKVGLTYKRFFLQARNPREWVFEDRADADAMFNEVFGD